jgi:hypothetical protein
LRAEDIPEVAALWLKVFRRKRVSAPEALCAYFHEMFFETPWRNLLLPSLVCTAGARIVGFLGVLPRAMTFRGAPIRVAVATQLMIDEEARGLYPGVRLMKHFFSGPQDLSFSDGANDASERLWKAAGGHISLLQSLEWTRVLRPVQHAMVQLERRRPECSGPVNVLRPMWRLCDGFAVRGALGRWLRRYVLPKPGDITVERNPRAEELLWCIRNLSGARALQPQYHEHSMDWLLRKAGEKKAHGPLRKSIVRQRAGPVLGWYLYYLRPGGVAHVLQFGGLPKVIGIVLEALYLEAWKSGGVAVSGALDAAFARPLGQSRCRFALSSYTVVAHSRRPEILDAINRGDAFKTRLEGEWWARFSDPDWLSPADNPRERKTMDPPLHGEQEAHAG